MKLVGVSGSLTGHKTAAAVKQVLHAAQKADPSIDIELIDLKDYDIEFVVGKPLALYNEDTQNVVAKIVEADAVLFGTAIYQASITGALKNMLDHLPVTALQSKVVGMVSTAGSKNHMLVAEYQLKPILSFFRAYVATTSVFLQSECFNNTNEITNLDVLLRIETLANEMLHLHHQLNP
ncbi:NADPH-dependent FMN reductase [Bacillus testis]|uniref:NADPH-dependent FMN reductase n=1 Tax=Bacillus testis TaxID=1622072 RepID=UPI00067E7012|nr:NAD(P)H-dependent oxidoreductase [Bacillus testis]